MGILRPCSEARMATGFGDLTSLELKGYVGVSQACIEKSHS